MKKISFLLCLLLLVAGCNKVQTVHKEKPAVQSPGLYIVDHPAALVLNSGQINSDKPAIRPGGAISKILSPFHVPVLNPPSSAVEFVKNNGDRMRIDLKKLPHRYDVILFNTYSDPVFCKWKDLRNAALDCFAGRKSMVVNTLHQKQESRIQEEILNENLGRQLSDSINHLRRNGKPLRIVVSDTAHIPLSIRNLPGVVWIENKPDNRRVFSLGFENDLISIANTDRYYTNGINLELQAPLLGRTSASHLLLSYRHQATVAYSLRLVQNMYTPKDTRIAPTFKNDRPYASYLSLGLRKTVKDSFRKIRLNNEIVIGYLGPYSPGAYLQSLVHETLPTNDPPQGWDSQIKTDLILNYNLKAEKAIVDQQNVMVSAGLSANAGTLYTNTSAGMRVQLGRQESYFGSFNDPRSWQYFFFLETSGSYIAYDATLEGGVFTAGSNIFRLRSSELSHWTGNAEVGMQVRYKGTGIELAQHYLSPEYKGGLWHQWGKINLFIKF